MPLPSFLFPLQFLSPILSFHLPSHFRILICGLHHVKWSPETLSFWKLLHIRPTYEMHPLLRPVSKYFRFPIRIQYSGLLIGPINFVSFVHSLVKRVWRLEVFFFIFLFKGFFANIRSDHRGIRVFIFVIPFLFALVVFFSFFQSFFGTFWSHLWSQFVIFVLHHVERPLHTDRGFESFLERRLGFVLGWPVRAVRLLSEVGRGRFE